MKTISQRELRNDNAAVIREVEDGTSFTVTRRGVPVARLLPLAEDGDLPCDRPARSRPTYATRTRARSAVRTDEILEDLRGGR